MLIHTNVLNKRNRYVKSCWKDFYLKCEMTFKNKKKEIILPLNLNWHLTSVSNRLSRRHSNISLTIRVIVELNWICADLIPHWFSAEGESWRVLATSAGRSSHAGTSIRPHSRRSRSCRKPWRSRRSVWKKTIWVFLGLFIG